jgi:hypothetical protein
MPKREIGWSDDVRADPGVKVRLPFTPGIGDTRASSHTLPLMKKSACGTPRGWLEWRRRHMRLLRPKIRVRVTLLDSPGVCQKAFEGAHVASAG